ncbi:hypothetical protein OAA11_01700 [Schleiferiaceae bacterium]|nr:hypothetical protein [Schleiferiaceae bacterium]
MAYLLSFKAFFVSKRASNCHCFLDAPERKFSEDVSKRIGSGGTVTYSAIRMAVALDTKKIVLVGIDHNFGSKYSNSLDRIEKFKADDNFHFDKNYFKANLWGTPDLDELELGYKRCLKFCQANDIEFFMLQ